MPNIPVPADISADWLRIARRMEAAAKKYPSMGYSVITLAVLVNNQGVPLFWASPQVTPIEPAKSDAILHYLTAALRLLPMPKPPEE
jgi:hypothetical protein